MIPWRRAAFNLGHLAIALMFAEGWITVGFTANWDLLVLNAADSLETADLPCPFSLPTLRLTGLPMHVHVHGRADAPETLVATTNDLSRPDALDWTEPQLRGALTMGEPMLVGFAVEPDYVVATLENMLDVMGVAPAAVISLDVQADFCAKSPRLAAAVGLTPTEGPYVSGSATECLGEVLRHRCADVIQAVLGEAERRARGASSAVTTKEGVERVRGILLEAPLADVHALLWRAAVLSSNDLSARQPILRHTVDHLADALAVLMIISSLHDVTDLDVTDEVMRVSHSTGSLDVWISIPGRKRQITEVVTATTQGSSHFSRPGDDKVPLLLICARTFGRPPPGGPSSLVPRMSPGAPSGRLTAHQRYPADVLTLDEVDDRCRTTGGSSPPLLSKIVRI